MPHRTETIIRAKNSNSNYKFNTLIICSVCDNSVTFAKIFPPKVSKIPQVKISADGQHIIITVFQFYRINEYSRNRFLASKDHKLFLGEYSPDHFWL